jgi:hypothetical protein
MSQDNSHWLDVRDKSALLHRFMVEFAGDTRMSIEGFLEKCQFDEKFEISHAETAVLKRNTIIPKLDFIILQLLPEKVGLIFDQVMKASLDFEIIHIQIESKGVIVLGAYDNFDHNCVVSGPAASVELLEGLKQKDIIRGYGIATPPPAT